MSLKKLESQIFYKYKDISLLELALVHKSSNNKNNNERLEFLGDSILNIICLLPCVLNPMILFLVVCDFLEVMETFLLSIALIIVDLPTLGLPMIET